MIINGGGAGGTGSDECTARLSDIPAGLKAVTADSNDEAGVGTMAMTGNAQAAHVLAGETFYTNNYKTKLTGTMTVNSLLNFSVAVYSGRRVLAKWQNPNQAAGKPFSGVIIRYSTSGYPGTTGGTQIYKGAGNNTAAGAWSQAYLDMPALDTTYYFSCYPYVTIGGGVINGIVRNVTCKTGAEINKTFTASGLYTIPTGYTKADIFAVGGGGCGLFKGGGGGAGYAKTAKNVTVLSGQVLNIVVGAGGLYSGSSGKPGAASSVTRSSTTLIVAEGGKISTDSYYGSDRGGDGGSGGGGSGYVDNKTIENGGTGGSNGSDGNTNYGSHGPGTGQGTTTRAWGAANGTLYAGGGGGGGDGYTGSSSLGGAGGAGGGGKGGNGSISSDAGNGAAGTANTGGGGGGGGKSHRGNNGSGSNGGSGIVLIKVY